MTFASLVSGQSKSELQVVGLTIAAADPASEYGQSLLPGTQPGTQVYVRVALPEQYILELAEKGHAIELSDQSGKALPASDSPNFGFYATVSEDHHAVVMPISSSGVPPTGTEHLVVKGEVAVMCGSELTESEVDVKLAESEMIELGSTSAKITSIGTGFEENTASVDLESKSPFNAIKELRFVDAGGKEHVAQPRGSGRFGFGGDVTYSQSYEFGAAAEDIKSVKLSYFKDIVTVKVPLDLKVGLGLGQ
jgi:hypothetical protein